MIIDIILDRKAGAISYNPKELYDYAMSEMYIGSYEKIARAMDCMEEKDVKKALCEYIDNEQYNPAIKDYINSVDWIMSESDTNLVHKVRGINIYRNNELEYELRGAKFFGIESNNNFSFTFSNTESVLVLSKSELESLAITGQVLDGEYKFTMTK